MGAFESLNSLGILSKVYCIQGIIFFFFFKKLTNLLLCPTKFALVRKLYTILEVDCLKLYNCMTNI